MVRSHVCVAVWPSDKVVQNSLVKVKFWAEPLAIFLDDTWLGIIKVAERKPARETIDSLCSALVQTSDSIQHARPHLWNLVLLLLCKMLQRALRCGCIRRIRCSRCCNVGCLAGGCVGLAAEGATNQHLLKTNSARSWKTQAVFGSCGRTRCLSQRCSFHSKCQ